MHSVKIVWLIAAVTLSACAAPSGTSLAASRTEQGAAPEASNRVAAKAPRTHSSGNEATVAAMTTKTDDRILRDSYYECVESNDGSTWDMQSCVETEFDYQDARLNTVYRDLISKLSGEHKERLRGEERQWVAERDSVCTWDANTEGQAQRIEANVCALKKTAERVAELEKALRELGSD